MRGASLVVLGCAVATGLCATGLCASHVRVTSAGYKCSRGTLSSLPSRDEGMHRGWGADAIIRVPLDLPRRREEGEDLRVRHCSGWRRPFMMPGFGGREWRIARGRRRVRR